jgi:hypothetical protein
LQPVSIYSSALLGHEHQRWPARPSSQVENKLEGIFHSLHFVVGEVADVLSEGARIDGSNHLAKNLRRMIENGDLWVEAGWERGARSRAHHDG